MCYVLYDLQKMLTEFTKTALATVFELFLMAKQVSVGSSKVFNM